MITKYRRRITEYFKKEKRTTDSVDVTIRIFGIKVFTLDDYFEAIDSQENEVGFKNK